MSTSPQKIVVRSAAPVVQRAKQPAAVAVPFVRVVVQPGAPQTSTSLRVSSPEDSAEREAERTAQRVVNMPEPRRPTSDIRRTPLLLGRSRHVARLADHIVQREPSMTRRSAGAPRVATDVAAEIRASQSGGAQLPSPVRRFMEPRFGAQFDAIRIHTGERAARLSRQLSARAFTVGNHVFFGRDQFQPDSASGRELIAHELTHTIQQGAAVQRSVDGYIGGEAIAAFDGATVSHRSDAQVQRLGVSDAWDYFAEQANLISGFRMFTIIVGMNPLNMRRVDRSAANILRALVEFLPGGGLITKALDRYGIFDQVGVWVERQLGTLGLAADAIRKAVDEFLHSLSWTDIFNLGQVWSRAKRILTEPIDRIFQFAGGLAVDIVRMIKNAILRPLAQLARGTPGYELLTAVLKRDPITGEDVPRTPEALIGGFMKLIRQEEVWNDLRRANAIPRAWAWFQGALEGAAAFVRQIPTLFLAALRQLELADVVLLPQAFAKIASVFGGFIGQFTSWAGQQVLSLLEILFEVVAPKVMPYIRRAAGAVRTIVRNPIGFLANLVRAGALGFRQFAANFLPHLRASLIGWLTGAMAGANLYIPQSFTLREIIKFVLSVLGLTWQSIRVKLVRAVGETAVGLMESGFDLVMSLVTQGPAAAWEKIQESFDNLREMVTEQIVSFVKESVVQFAIKRLLLSLNPAGAFIQAILATYDTIMFFVERLRQIADVALAILDSLSAIASGAIAAAANRVERTMEGLLTLVISFLARFAGLNKVSDKVMQIINRIRQPIDRALDRIVAWIVATARRVGRFVAQAGLPKDPKERLRLGMNAAVSAVNSLRDNVVTESLIRPLLTAIRVRYGFKALRAVQVGDLWWVEGVVNPDRKKPTKKRASKQDKAETQAELEALVKPRPDVTYPMDGGRPKGPSGFVKGVKESGAGRDSMTSENLPGYETNDQRGHLIGDRFYGPGARENLVPMAPYLNLSSYKSSENQLAEAFRDLKKAKRPALLKITVTPAYDDASYRPDSVRIVGVVYTLKSSKLDKKKIDSGSLHNPSPTVDSVNVNASADVVKARFWVLTKKRLRTAAHRHALADAIKKARENGRPFTNADFRSRWRAAAGGVAHMTKVLKDSEITF